MPDYIPAAFQVLSFAPGPFWLALLLVPKNRWAMTAFDAFLILLSVHFTLLTLPGVPALLPVIAAPTFETVSAFLTTPMGILGSWNHMILSDLWIGRWMVYDGMRKNIPRALLSIFLIATLFFGPLGLCFYLITRALLRRRWRLTNGDEAY